MFPSWIAYVLEGTREVAVNAELGEEGACDPYQYESGSYVSSRSSCDWSIGLSASFDDEDQDGAPDEGAETSSVSLIIGGDFAGGTTEGLGLGASMSCFVEQYGDPDSVDFRSARTADTT